ncbi:MAG: hypothetical protein MSA95_00355 [Bacteroides sp.]|nr:hypothetical protein [Bacteroides sp.]MED9900629.1 hypothetical protein [Bacteroidales bacterium]
MSRFDTCFFERYARVSLEKLLDEGFAALLNKDRPDLQSADGRSIGIEVTRAMPESKEAADTMLKEMAGIRPVKSAGVESEDLDSMLASGYGYGLDDGQYVGSREYDYWSLALPMRRIIENKVSKAGNGFYGEFESLALYVFSKDALSDSEVADIMDFTMNLQSENKIRYDFLYLSEINNLNVCDLRSAQMVCHPISRVQRRDFFLASLEH